MSNATYARPDAETRGTAAHGTGTRGRTATDLRALAARGAEELGPDAGAEALLQWTARTFGTDFVIASNMQDAALIDVAVGAIDPADLDGDDLRILFLDTGYHFVETIGTRDAVEQIYAASEGSGRPGVRMLNVTPEHTPAQQDQLLGRNLFASDPAECCRLRKVVPLQNALSGYSAWVTGIRRVEAPTRASAPLISFDETFGLVKINPLAAWSDDQMHEYIESHGVLVNPLVDEGYPSIGCEPCTLRPAAGADPRSGRWAGRAKTECGLHAS